MEGGAIQSAALRVLVIEDDGIVAADICDAVEIYGGVIAGMAADSFEAVNLARREKPDLVISDLRLTDGPTGISAIGRIREFLDPAVVIVTGHPEPLVRGRTPDNAALVLKPFLPEALHRAIEAAVSARIWGVREAG